MRESTKRKMQRLLEDVSTKMPAISKEEFFKSATMMVMDVNGVKLIASPRMHRTGSYGWYINGKFVTEVGGKKVPVQVSACFTVINSKPDASGAGL
jgi:hypothetical protein